MFENMTLIMKLGIIWGCILLIFFTYVNYKIAEAKKMNVGFIIIASILLTPIITWFYVHGFPNQQNSKNISKNSVKDIEEKKNWKCPKCNNYNKPDSFKCINCGYSLK